MLAAASPEQPFARLADDHAGGPRVKAEACCSRLRAGKDGMPIFFKTPWPAVEEAKTSSRVTSRAVSYWQEPILMIAPGRSRVSGS
jgi:hypothetical protein